MTDRPEKRPPPLWAVVGPALTALAMVLLLRNPKISGAVWMWVPVLILVGSLALIAYVLLQRRRATERNR